MILIKEDEKYCFQMLTTVWSIKMQGSSVQNAMTLAQRRQASARTMPSSQERISSCCQSPSRPCKSLIARVSMRDHSSARQPNWAPLAIAILQNEHARVFTKLHYQVDLRDLIEWQQPGKHCPLLQVFHLQGRVVRRHPLSDEMVFVPQNRGTEDALGMRLWHNWFQIFFAAVLLELWCPEGRVECKVKFDVADVAYVSLGKDDRVRFHVQL